MNRRGFLSLLGGVGVAAAAGVTLPELWTPERTIFLPPAGGWAVSGNTLLTPELISREALRILRQNFAFHGIDVSNPERRDSILIRRPWTP